MVVGRVWVGRGEIFELVHANGGAASGEEEDGEGGVGDIGIPGAVGFLDADKIVCALGVPIGGAEEFSSAGGAEFFDGVEGVIAVGGFENVSVVLAEPT